ncbi:MAG: AraC family transcriptional regulator, partial [Pseudomonadota bacterium]|nr:AraC family transcriptional regulator [Pseudomonadota bacterium]
HSMSDIALLLGFNDQSHFSRVFKNHEGITPSQFIKQYSA